jgi:hypothetical protein
MVHDLRTNVTRKAANADSSDTTLLHCVRDVAVALRLWWRWRHTGDVFVRDGDAGAHIHADDAPHRRHHAVARGRGIFGASADGDDNGKRAGLLGTDHGERRDMRHDGKRDAGVGGQRAGTVHRNRAKLGIMHGHIH